MRTFSVSCVVVCLQDGVHLQLLVPRRRGVEPVLVVDGDLCAGGEGAAAAQRGDVAEPGVAVQAERGVRPETVVSLGTVGNDVINQVYLTIPKMTPIVRLYSVKTDIFKNAFFWYFFIRNDLSRIDLIIKMVLEFLSNL